MCSLKTHPHVYTQVLVCRFYSLDRSGWKLSEGDTADHGPARRDRYRRRDRYGTRSRHGTRQLHRGHRGGNTHSCLRDSVNILWKWSDFLQGMPSTYELGSSSMPWVIIYVAIFFNWIKSKSVIGSDTKYRLRHPMKIWLSEKSFPKNFKGKHVCLLWTEILSYSKILKNQSTLTLVHLFHFIFGKIFSSWTFCFPGWCRGSGGWELSWQRPWCQQARKVCHFWSVCFTEEGVGGDLWAFFLDLFLIY